MDRTEDIKVVFLKYLKATYSGNTKDLLALLYQDDVINFHKKMVEFAHLMDQFGETEDFLTRIGIESLAQLDAMDVEEFMHTIISLAAKSIGKDSLEKILAETKILSIEEVDVLSYVKYEFPIKLFDEWVTYRGELEMIRSQNEWKILFKSGMEISLRRFVDDVDRYFDRKSRDNLSQLEFEDNLALFTLVGYRDFESGRVVFEPRFKDAGEFNNGRAYVQIMNKYGYIDLKGELVIKAQYLDAQDFSEKLAAVKVLNHNGKEKWGFINKKGEMTIPAQYKDANTFSEGLCAVKKNKKWGFIDKKGKVIIPFKFDAVEDFLDGIAYVEISSSKGQITEFVLNKKGEILEID